MFQEYKTLLEECRTWCNGTNQLFQGHTEGVGLKIETETNQSTNQTNKTQSGDGKPSTFASPICDFTNTGPLA